MSGELVILYGSVGVAAGFLAFQLIGLVRDFRDDTDADAHSDADDYRDDFDHLADASASDSDRNLNGPGWYFSRYRQARRHAVCRNNCRVGSLPRLSGGAAGVPDEKAVTL